MKKTDVIVFDFDGTLSGGDANAEFVKYCFKHSLRPYVFLPYMIVALIVKLFVGPNPDYRCNKVPVIWRQLFRRFINQKLINKLRPGFIAQHRKRRFDWARAQVADEHYSKNVRVVLISAGMDYLIPELVRDMKFDAVITSRTNPQKPWQFEFFCYGQNKVVALDTWARENKIIPNVVRSYGDAPTDKYIMDVAYKQIWINPKTGEFK